MKAYYLFLSIAILAVFSLPALAGPRVTCAEPTFNFGDLSSQEKVRHVFRLVNEGDETLKLGTIKTACGCTSASVSKEEVAPGDSADLVVVFDLSRRYGLQHKWVRIDTNDPAHEKFELWLKGNAIADIVATPANILERFIEPDKVLKRTVRIASREDDVTFNIKRILPTMSVAKTRLEVVTPGKAYDLFIEVPPQAVGAEVYENIMVSTDSKRLPYFSIQVRGKVASPLQVTPNPIALTHPPAGSTVTRFMTVRPGSVSEFEITAVRWPRSDAEVEILPATRFGTRIRISNIAVDAGLNGEVLRIETTAKNAEHIDIPIVVKQ